MNVLLLSAGARGIFWCALLFLFPFLIVHGAKLALIGWNAHKRKSEPPKSEPAAKKEPPPIDTPEPVYYIVEKKQRKPKPSYSEPKQIKFK